MTLPVMPPLWMPPEVRWPLAASSPAADGRSSTGPSRRLQPLLLRPPRRPMQHTARRRRALRGTRVDPSPLRSRGTGAGAPRGQRAGRRGSSSHSAQRAPSPRRPSEFPPFPTWAVRSSGSGQVPARPQGHKATRPQGQDGAGREALQGTGCIQSVMPWQHVPPVSGPREPHPVPPPAAAPLPELSRKAPLEVVEVGTANPVGLAACDRPFGRRQPATLDLAPNPVRTHAQFAPRVFGRQPLLEFPHA